MGRKVLAIKRVISASRMIPHIFLYLRNRKKFDLDLVKYSRGERGIRYFIDVCTCQKVYRNLFYYRIGYHKSFFISWLLPPEKSLHITCPLIGEGAHFEHNYSTYLNANSIGENFFCLHLVTLGKGQNGRPTIGNNVSIYTGSIIFGDVIIGNNVIIGAGSVVTKSIPDNQIWAGNPAKFIREI